MKTWLMKSEPTEYSIDHLAQDGRSSWFGVRNYQARNFMRDMMQIGDRILFYHSSCAIPGIYGLAEVASPPHPDETQFIIGNKHYDQKSSRENPIWHCVDVCYIAKLYQPFTLTDIRATRGLDTMKILQRGNRLSITPVTETEWDIIEEKIVY